MSETFYVCRACASGKTLEDLRAYRPIVTRDGDTTRWDCPECGANIFLSFDMGTIDLGLLRNEQPADNDFEIFG